MARLCRVIWNGKNSFKVRDYQHDVVHVVDVKENTCTCGYWQLSGIPCEHVVSCAHIRKRKVEEFVSKYYKWDNYVAAYGTPIECTKGLEMWYDYKGERSEPPLMKRRPGRPRRNRIKPKGGEIKKTKVRGHERVMHCSSCGGEGHNRRGCPSNKSSDQADKSFATETSNVVCSTLFTC